MPPIWTLSVEQALAQAGGAERGLMSSEAAASAFLPFLPMLPVQILLVEAVKRWFYRRYPM